MFDLDKYLTVLKAEHIAILTKFVEIDATSDLTSLKVKVKELIKITVGHLTKEDSILYPALAADKNEEIKKMGILFSDTMKTYTEMFLTITNEILSSTELDDKLLAKYRYLRDKIKSRVVIEENVLYPAYKSIN